MNYVLLLVCFTVFSTVFNVSAFMMCVSSSWEIAPQLTGHLCQLALCLFWGSSDPEIRIIDHDLSFGQLFRRATGCLCEKGWKKGRRKSIGFHYLVGQCHWPVNDPVTAVVHGWHRPALNRCWQEENMLTGTGNKLEHRFALQAAVRGGIVQGHRAARGKLSWGGVEGLRGGCRGGQVLPSDCLALYHKRFYPSINYSPLDTPKETELHWLWLRGNS